jgi:hypothetical protein
MFVVIGGLAAMMSTPEQRAEANARWNYIGKRVACVAAVMVSVWVYMG